MTDHLTEDDLRSALLSLAPTDLDATDFRSRLDAVMAEGTLPDTPARSVPAPLETHDLDAANVLALTVPSTGLRSRRSRVALLATIAACAAAVLAIAVAVLPDGGHGDRSRPTPASSLPASLRAMALPGTVVLATYRGTGSRNVAIPAHAVPRYFEYGAFASCSGGGRLQVFDAGELQECNGSTTFGTSAPATTRTMTITAPTRTSWTVALVIQPQTRTNGNVQSPAEDPVGPNNGLRQSGRGSATLTFAGDDNASGTRPTHYSVGLTCSGTGVHLPDLNGTSANGGSPTTGGLITQTCFPGYEYSWQSVPLHLPHAIRITASADTRWTIFLDPAT